MPITALAAIYTLNKDGFAKVTWRHGLVTAMGLVLAADYAWIIIILFEVTRWTTPLK